MPVFVCLISPTGKLKFCHHPAGTGRVPPGLPARSRSRPGRTWLSVVEVYVDEAAPGKVTFKTGTGPSDSFDAAAFELGM